MRWALQTDRHYIPQSPQEFRPTMLNGCVLWLRADQGITLGATLLATGTTPPAVTISGSAAGPVGIRLEIQTTGARGAATFRYSADNGASFIESGKVTAATYAAIGALTGITFNFPNATYTNDNVYQSTVAQWNDLSGAGNNASNGAASGQPLMISNGLNGKPTVRFAAPQVLSHALGLTSGTVVAVAKTTGVTAQYLTICALDPGGGGIFVYAANPSGTSWGVYANAEANAGTPLAVFKKVIALYTAPTNIDFRTNGSQVHSGTGVSLYAAGAKTIGASNDAVNQNLTGDLAEIAVYNRVLSGSDCIRLEAYLGSRYAL